VARVETAAWEGSGESGQGTARRAVWRGWAAALSLETPALTAVYWIAVGLVVAGFFATHLLPCVDYPQHLALSDIARRLQDGGVTERAEYQLNYFTYNGLFHLLVAALSRAMPIELAGRLVVVASLLATSAAVVALLQVLRRPPSYAALFTPILFSFSLGWGFVNYVLATAIAAWALVFVARATRRPTALDLAAIAVLGFTCAFAHVLAMIILCVAAASVALEQAWRGSGPGPARARLGRTLLRTAVVLAPLLLGCVYCIAVYREQYAWNPVVYRDRTLEGTAPPLWQKVVFFPAFATDLYGDHSDAGILWATLAAIAWPMVAWVASRSWRSAPASPPAAAPFVVLTFAYFATPMVLIGTHLIFPRLAQWAVLGAVLAMPRFTGKTLTRARPVMAGLGLLAGANTLVHCVLYDRETRDASATLDELPAGRAATAVILEPWTESFKNGTLTHLAAYYAARKHGSWAFSFARYLSVPVRFLPGAQPAWPEHGWEFSGEDYDPRCKYARAFPLVIARAPGEFPVDASGEALVRKTIFKQDADRVKLLAHHGQYWAFDTAGLPDDGTL
jgi:hypothetical protein